MMNGHCAGPLSRPRGFSLTELLVILVILGLLAYFGIPAALKFSLQGRLNVVETALKQIAHQEAEWFGTHKAYASLRELGYPQGSALSAIYLNKDGAISENASRDSVYRIVINLNTTPGTADAPAGGAASNSPYYLLTAEPINDQAGDRGCGTLSLASTGQVGVSGTDGEAACWQK
jgi:prepilin-type N-terminal cleavage/methylation domain-containing protein